MGIFVLLGFHLSVYAQTSPNGAQVNSLSGFVSVFRDDLQVSSSAGPVRWTRVWDGKEWKFNPHWESLSQSWTNLNGGAGNTQCGVWADEDWSPFASSSPDEPLDPSRGTPFVKSMGKNGNDYIADRSITVNYASICLREGANLLPAQFGVSDGLRRGGELYLGNNGTYAFSTTAFITKQTVLQLTRTSAINQKGTLQSGRYPVGADTNEKGYRWQDRTGNWIDYNTEGQVVAWGDPNGNTIWLARDEDGNLNGVVDGNGQVLYTLHYTGKLLTEIRDYPSHAQDLPSRTVRYQYDNKNRLTQVTDPLGHITRYDYDKYHRLISITNAEGHSESFTYGSGSGREVLQHTAMDGSKTDYKFDYDATHQYFISVISGPETEGGRRVERAVYNRNGKLVERSVNGQLQESIRYDTGARKESITNARGFVTRHTRNEFDQIIETLYPDGSRIKRKYSVNHMHLIEETDELGIKTLYDYDTKGNLLKKTEAAGTPEERITEYTNNSQGKPIRITLKGRTEINGSITQDAVSQMEYNAQGQISKQTDPEGNIQQYLYNRAGHLIRSTNALGKITSFDIDGNGRLVKVTDPLGQEYRYSYDKVDNRTSQIDPRGQSIQMAYDAMSRLTQTTNAVGGTQKTRYNGQGLVVQQTDADGRAQQTEHDALLRLTRQLDGLGNTTEYSYTLMDGSASGILGSLGAPTEIRYPTYVQQNKFDERERLTRQTLKHRNRQGEEILSSSTLYDLRGQAKEELDAQGNKRSYQYDALSQLTEITDALGNKTQYHYDVRGNLIQVNDPRGKTYTFEYDRNSRMTKEVLPLGQTTHYTYDTLDRLTQQTDPQGYQATTTYDLGNRPIEIRKNKANGTLVRTITLAWDENNNLTAWTDTDTTRLSGQQQSKASLTYDDANRKIEETITYPTPNGTPYTLNYRYAYSSGGKKIQLTWPDGTALNYTYSTHGELESVTLPGEGNLSVSEFNWITPKQITLPGGSTQSKTYDGLLNLETLQVKTPGQQKRLELENHYGKRQELTQRTRTDTANSSSTQSNTYQYDAETRLTQATTDTGWLFGNSIETFTLDSVANRIGHSQVSGPWQYDANNRLIQKGSGTCGSNGTTCYQWDEGGNLTQKREGTKTTQYSYDSLNRLTEVRDGSNNLIARYGYDPFNRRLWKEQYRDKNGNALTQAKRTYYFYADEGLIAESTQVITLTGETVTASATPELITQYGPTPDSLFTTNTLFIKTKNSNGTATATVAYYHHDHLGTPIQATDKQGNIVWSASYEAFDRATITTPASTADKPTIQSNLRFPGQYEDEETGLHYNFNRYYDPETGRYITQDPIGLEGGGNFYAYVDGNPVSYIDPEGLASTLSCGASVANAAACAAAGMGVRGAARQAGRAVRSDSSSQEQDESDRAIWQPERNAGRWTCNSRADCNDNKPGNCPENPKHRFAFGGGMASSLGTARNIAKSNATSNLQCQPKHVSCKCTGPKGEIYSGGC